MKTAKARQRVWGALFFLPFGAGFALFYLVPFLRSLVRSFFRGRRFVGFANYIEVFRSGAFLLALKNTLCFLAAGLPLVMAGSFFLPWCCTGIFAAARYSRACFCSP